MVVGTVVLVGSLIYAMGDRATDQEASTTPAPTVDRPDPTSPADPPDPTGTPTPSATASPSIDRQPSPVAVLNQTAQEGLAGRASVVVDARGWPVADIDNVAVGAPATTLYVPAGLAVAGDAFLDDFPEVTRTRPALAGLAVDELSLVLAEPDAVAVVDAMETDQQGQLDSTDPTSAAQTDVVGAQG